MKKFFTLLFCFASILCLNAQTVCKTIAEIKAQPDKTYIKYTGSAKTTFYNGTGTSSQGLFMEDETGGILLKSYLHSARTEDPYGGANKGWIQDGMMVTNIVGTWGKGSTGTAPGITIATADLENASGEITATGDRYEIVPTRVTMAQLAENLSAYEGKAIIVTDANLTQENGKYFLNGIPYYSSKVSVKTPVAGEFAGIYLGEQYNRFFLMSAEHTKPTEFLTFSDMSAYYKSVSVEAADAGVRGAVLVNYVTKVDDTKTAIFAQYKGLTGLLNEGITIFVNGETNVQAGDSIDGIYGKYTDAYKNNAVVKDFKGAFFTQSADKAFNVRNSNNPEIVNSGVNFSDLLTNKVCMNYASQLISSRYSGELYSVDNKYMFKISYEISNPGEDSDELIAVYDSIRVIGSNGLDLSKHIGNNILLSGIYDARVIYTDEPTIIIRDAKDILVSYYSYNNIAELHAAGEPISDAVVYGLNNDVVVTYKRTQVNQGIAQTYAFIEDETGVLALDLASGNIDAVAGDKIRGLKGVYSDGIRYGFDRYHAPQYKLLEGVVPEIISEDNQPNILKATLKEVICDTMKYCSHIVEISNVGGSYRHYSDFTGETDDYFIYDMDSPEFEMHYSLGSEVGSVDPDALGIDKIMGENFILTALMNFNCLNGYYVFYALKLEKANEPMVNIDNNQISDVKVYSSNGTLYIETIGGQSLEVYTVAGQCVYTTTNSSNMTEINDLNGGVVVKVNGEVYKTIVK